MTDDSPTRPASGVGLATYDAEDTFLHADSEGYVKIYGLGVKTWAARQGAKNATPPSS